MILYLKHKNTVLAKLDYNLGVNIIEQYHSFYFQNNIESWVEGRKTLVSRKYALDLYKQGDIRTTKDFILVSKCLSIEDCYWITDSINDKWEKFSLFRQSFSRILTSIASGLSGFNGNPIRTPSPEYTIGGNSCKFLRHEDGFVYLYKTSGGLSELSYSGVYSEFLVSQLLDCLGVSNFVRYNIVQYDNRLFSKSKIFTSEDTELINICYLYDDAIHLDEHICHYSGKLLLQFRLMLIIDCIVNNVDRHDENISVIVKDGNIVGLAPMYDFDHALYYNVPLVGRSKSYILDCIKGDVPRTWVNHSFKEQFDFCIISDILPYIKRLCNFRFRNHDKYPMEPKRLDMINKLFQYKLRGYLDVRV